ncbi:MAG: sigma-70 family RNA polymerase sigma factor [Bacteroidales bacterium]|jgi:DNA-directed RNA polymerase specialized sigma24 family protein|nr:sigma-70 family RNA polymerase sigma factor [Clostridiales bacterium]NLC50488.1 sigma-70 family RNA polymerase sigma factor [Bacteroidales bacterium]
MKTQNSRSFLHAFSMDRPAAPDVAGQTDDFKEKEVQEGLKHLLLLAKQKMTRLEYSVFEAYFLKNLPMQMVAAQTGLSLVAVKSHIFRTRRKMKKLQAVSWELDLHLDA